MLLSCLCFAEMSIYFCFGEFRANSLDLYVLSLGKVMPNFCMTLMHACIFIINFFIITMRAFMMVSGTMVDKWLRSVVQDMKENNLTEVLCPCRKCKGIVWLDPYDDGRVEAHLLMTDFMDGYTWWIIEVRMMMLRTPTGQAMTTRGKTKR